MKVRAVLREAREAYDKSYGYAKKVLEIPELAEALELYLKQQEDCFANTDECQQEVKCPRR